jgi:hypothetical protein
VSKVAHSAGFVGQPLAWVGETPPGEQESQELWEITGAGTAKRPDDIAPLLESFVKAHPQSAWRPAIENLLARLSQLEGLTVCKPLQISAAL